MSVNDSPQAPNSNSDASSAVSLVVLYEKLRQRWADVLIAAIAGILIGIIYLWIARPLYSADIILAPPQDEQSQPQLSGTLAAFSGLSGLAMGGGQVRFDTFINLLQSNIAAEQLSKDDAIMHTIFASQWDEQTKSWHRPSGLVVMLKSVFRIFLGRSSWSPPTAQDLETYIEQNVAISDFNNASFANSSNMKKLTFQYPRPEFAKYFLQKLYSVTDNGMKTKALARTNTYIAYLNNRLASIQTVEHREALGQILVSQERTRMLIQVNLPYAADIVSPANVSDEPSSPKLGVSLILCIIVAMGLTITGILIGMPPYSNLWRYLQSKVWRRRLAV